MRNLLIKININYIKSILCILLIIGKLKIQNSNYFDEFDS